MAAFEITRWVKRKPFWGWLGDRVFLGVDEDDGDDDDDDDDNDDD